MKVEKASKTSKLLLMNYFLNLLPFAFIIGEKKITNLFSAITIHYIMCNTSQFSFFEDHEKD